MKKFLTLMIASLLVLAGCQNNTGPKQGVGTLLGAVGGAVAGSQFGSGKGQLVGVAAGTLLGAFIGSEIGSSLDKADLAYANQTANHAFERNSANQTSSWNNPESGNRGTITPTTPTYQTAQGGYCREFQQTVMIEGKSETAYGTACRNNNGEWIIQ